MTELLTHRFSSPIAARDKRKQSVRAEYTRLHTDFVQAAPSQNFRNAFHQGLTAAVRRRLENGRTVRMVDVGCGHGMWLGELLTALPQARGRLDYIGFDLTPTRIEHARAAYAAESGVRFLVSDIDHFEPRQPCDVVLVIEVLPHTDRAVHAALLTRWAGWLAPGGALVIIDKERFTRHAAKLAWDRWKRRLLPAAWRGRPYYFPTHYAGLADDLRYPAFSTLLRAVRRAGLTAEPPSEHGLFRTLVAEKPAA